MTQTDGTVRDVKPGEIVPEANSWNVMPWLDWKWIEIVDPDETVAVKIEETQSKGGDPRAGVSPHAETAGGQKAPGRREPSKPRRPMRVGKNGKEYAKSVKKWEAVPDLPMPQETPSKPEKIETKQDAVADVLADYGG